jgi:leucyl-tRNA synthetase
MTSRTMRWRQYPKYEEDSLPALDESLAAAGPIVSTTGFAGEGRLRRVRRLVVADVFAHFLAQTLGQPVSLRDVAVVDGADETVRKQYVPSAAEVLRRLPPSRLAVTGDQLVLSGDDLLHSVLDASAECGWPEAVLAPQRVAIGGSRGALARFSRTDDRGDIEVFTTRPDTIFGATFLAVSPSHPAAQLARPDQWAAFHAECDRMSGDPTAKVGVPLELSVQNPLDPDRTLPVWLGNFVVESYGTGAAGGCPACDQRDLDFARRYGLPVISIVCPPGQDPRTYEVGSESYAGADGTIINSGFLSGLPIPEAINAAIAHLVEVGRGVPTVQFRRRPLVVAEAAGTGVSEFQHAGGSWRYTDAFLTAAALLDSPAAAGWRPHLMHVTEPEAATRHLLDARVLQRALADGTQFTAQEPWDEIVLVGDVVPSPGTTAELPAGEGEAVRIAMLADTPPEREAEWSDKRYASAARFIDGTAKLFSTPGVEGGMDQAGLAAQVGRAAGALENALRRRRTNNAVAAVREIVSATTAAATRTGLDRSAEALAGSLLYPILPELAARALAAAGVSTTAPPTWPAVNEEGGQTELVELMVQINGKKRGSVQVPPGADEDTVIAAVRADASLSSQLGDRTIRKAVVVPNRLVNIVA